MTGDRLRELLEEHAELPGDGWPIESLEWPQFEAAARALLAEAQPVSTPTDEELESLAKELDDLPVQAPFAFARAVLARWGRPAPELTGAHLPVRYRALPVPQEQADA